MKSDINIKKQMGYIRQKIKSKKGLRFASFLLFLGSGIVGSFSRMIIKEIDHVYEMTPNANVNPLSRVWVPSTNLTLISGTSTSYVSYSVEMIAIAVTLLISGIILFCISIKKK